MTDKTFIITPNEGYEIDDVLVDGDSVGALSECIFTDISSDHTITAIFVYPIFYTFGDHNYDGELGLGDNDSRDELTWVDTNHDWEKISAGGFGYEISTSYAIKTDGTLWGWGANNNGQLGLGDTNDRNVPVQVGSDTNWSKINGNSGNHCLSIKTDGTLWSCGYNHDGQLGLGDTNDRNVPVQVGSDTDWDKINLGGVFSIAIKTDGTLWSCGDNIYGQLGLGDAGAGTERLTLTQVSSGGDWEDISTGQSFCIAIKTDGTLWVWGRNYNGSLGLGESDTDHRYEPVQLGSDNNWSKVACGEYHTLAIKTDGTLWGWGYNSDWQLGLGDTDHRYIPTQVGSDIDWLKITSSRSYSIAIKTDGTLWGWGESSLWVWGEGSVPNQINSSNNWLKVSNGSSHTLALKSNI